MTERLTVGISPCPNDTFAFHALLAGEVETPGLELAFEIADVEELNERMLGGNLDAAKVSFHAALAMAERVVVLPSGSALGFGVGPLVLAGRGRTPFPGEGPAAEPPHVLVPGRWTTAALLWRLFHPEPTCLEPRLFSEILPALARGEADGGVCIHEGRFVYPSFGLGLVEDLGTRWEEATGAPLPLGGIVAGRSLPPARRGALQEAIRASLAWAEEHRLACLPTMRRHAPDQPDDVLWKHVELYVNRRTHELDEEGRGALVALAAVAAGRGLVPADRRLVVGP